MSSYFADIYAEPAVKVLDTSRYENVLEKDNLKMEVKKDTTNLTNNDTSDILKDTTNVASNDTSEDLKGTTSMANNNIIRF